MAPVFTTLHRLLSNDPIAGMVTVVGVRGSTPREAGARMVVSADSAISGTIGGGRLELDAIQAALDLMKTGADDVRVLRYALGPSLGQCCGGDVTLVLETVTARRRPEIADLVAAEAAGPFVTEATVAAGAPVVRRVLGDGATPRSGAELSRHGLLLERFGRPLRPVMLFGAGHVGRALVLALAPLPFAVTWIDEREEMFPGAVPRHVRRLLTGTPVALVAEAPPASFALVMTHDHGIDLDLLEAILRDGRYAYVGLIGSQTKRARFERRLVERGLAADLSTAFRCPIGVPGIRSKEPAMIAAAVAAELLIAHEASPMEAAPAVANPSDIALSAL